MSGAIPALVRTPKRDPSNGPPFIPASARNGASIDALGKIVLGNDVGGVLATLVSNREIPSAGFNVALSGAGKLLVGTVISSGPQIEVAGDGKIRNMLIDDGGVGLARLFSGNGIIVQGNGMAGDQVVVQNAVVGFAGNSIFAVRSSQAVPATSNMFSVDNNLATGLAVKGDSTVVISGAVSYGYRATAVAATFGIQDHTIDANGVFAVSLPTAVGIAGRVYILKNSGVGVVTLTPFGAETIDGAATKPVAAGGFTTVQSTGAGWIIIG